MFAFIKLLKVSLPLATVTSATVATALLVSSTKNDIEKKNKEKNSILRSFEKEVEEFQQREIFYSDQGTADSPVDLNEKDSKQMKELLEKGVKVSDQGSTDLSKIQPPSGVPEADQDVSKSHIPDTSLTEAGEQGMEISVPKLESDVEEGSEGGGGQEDNLRTSQETTAEAEGREEEGEKSLQSESLTRETSENEDTRVQGDPAVADASEQLPNSNDLQQAGSDEERRGESVQEEHSESEGDSQKGQKIRDGDSEDGSDNESKVNLEHLENLKNKLSDSENALGAILAGLNI